jgi:hypothetical protein
MCLVSQCAASAVMSTPGAAAGCASSRGNSRNIHRVCSTHIEHQHRALVSLSSKTHLLAVCFAALRLRTPAVPLNCGPLSNGPAGARCSFPAALAAAALLLATSPAARPLQSALPRLLQRPFPPFCRGRPPFCPERCGVHPGSAPHRLRRLRPFPNPANPFARPDWLFAAWPAATLKTGRLSPKSNSHPGQRLWHHCCPHVRSEMRYPQHACGFARCCHFHPSP